MRPFNNLNLSVAGMLSLAVAQDGKEKASPAKRERPPMGFKAARKKRMKRERQSRRINQKRRKK